MHTKTKLELYVRIGSFDEQPCLVKIGMTRWQRSLMSKLFCGILPLELETGRYQGVKRKKDIADSVSVIQRRMEFISSSTAARSREHKKGLHFDIGDETEEEEEDEEEDEEVEVSEE